MKIFSTIFFLLVLTSTTVLTPAMVFAQGEMDFELSGVDETYVTLDSIMVSGASYDIISYQNGDVVLLNGQGELVLDSLLLNEVFTVKSYKDLFTQNGITNSKFNTVSSALNTLHSNAELVSDVMTWLAIGATLLGIGSLLIGGVAIPFAAIVDAVAFVTSYVTNNLQTPLSTANLLQQEMNSLAGADSSSSKYSSILSMSVQLRDELSDLNNKLILSISGYGNIAYYEALYTIADAIEGLSSDYARDLRNQAFNIETSQKTLESSLDWLESLNVDVITSNSNSQANTYSSSQKSRLASRLTNYQSELNAVNIQIENAEDDVVNRASQGADISVSNSFIIQTSSKIEIAENHASRYEYRTALLSLGEASSLSQKAIDCARISLIIHQVEVKIDETQNVINNKASKGANVETATSKLNEAKTAVQNSKSLLASNPSTAEQIANNALSYVNDAALDAEMAAEPQYAKEEEMQEQVSTSENERDTSGQLPAEFLYVILLLIAIVIVLVLVIFVIYRKRSNQT